MRNQLHGSKEKLLRAADTARHVLCCVSLAVDVFRPNSGIRYEANNPLYIAGSCLIAMAVHFVWVEGLILWADKTDWSQTILPPHGPSTVFLAFVSITMAIAIHNFVMSFYSAVIKKRPSYSKEKGISFVSSLFPQLDEGAYFLEAAFFIAAGYQLTRWCDLTGWYIACCSLALVCRLAIEYATDTRRRISIDDLTIDGRNIRPNIRGGNHL